MGKYTVSCFIWVWNLVPHITKEHVLEGGLKKKVLRKTLRPRTEE